MNEKMTPTHVLSISVPMYVSDDFDFNPLQEALRVIMPLTHLATTDAICGDCTVSVTDVRTWGLVLP